MSDINGVNAIAVSGVDQYLAILYPLEYSTKVTRLMSWLLIGLVWGFGVLASVLGSLKLVSLSSPWTSCRVALKTADGGGHVVSRWWLAGINAVLYMAPLCLLSFIYLRIFFVARKNSRKIRRKNTSSVRMNAEALSGGNLDCDEDGGVEGNPEFEMSSIYGSGAGPHHCSSHAAPAGMRKASYEFSISFGKAEKGKATNMNGRKRKKRVVSVPSMSCPATVFDEDSTGNQLAPPLRQQRLSSPKRKGASNGHAGLDATVSCPSAAAEVEEVKKRRIRKPKLRYNKSLASTASASSKENSLDSSSCSLTPTPKRKCSFSSYSECRLVEEEGEGGDGAAKHQTFLFSIEAPSPPPTPVVYPEPAEHLLSPGLMGVPAPGASGGGGGGGGGTSPRQNCNLSAHQRRRRFSHASPLNAAPSQSTLASRRSNCSSANNSSLGVGVSQREGGNDLDAEEEEEAIRNRRVRRSASILSMTSQVGIEPKSAIAFDEGLFPPTSFFGKVLMTPIRREGNTHLSPPTSDFDSRPFPPGIGRMPFDEEPSYSLL